jgi:hypothetical protein
LGFLSWCNGLARDLGDFVGCPAGEESSFDFVERESGCELFREADHRSRGNVAADSVAAGSQADGFEPAVDFRVGQLLFEGVVVVDGDHRSSEAFERGGVELIASAVFPSRSLAPCVGGGDADKIRVTLGNHVGLAFGQGQRVASQCGVECSHHLFVAHVHFVEQEHAALLVGLRERPVDPFHFHAVHDVQAAKQVGGGHLIKAAGEEERAVECSGDLASDVCLAALGWPGHEDVLADGGQLQERREFVDEEFPGQRLRGDFVAVVDLDFDFDLAAGVDRSFEFRDFVAEFDDLRVVILLLGLDCLDLRFDLVELGQRFGVDPGGSMFSGVDAGSVNPCLLARDRRLDLGDEFALGNGLAAAEAGLAVASGDPFWIFKSVVGCCWCGWFVLAVGAGCVVDGDGHVWGSLVGVEKK